MRALTVVLTFAVWMAPGLCVAQSESTTPRPYNTLPDWSGVWSMVGGTVFDRATQTGEGGATSVGVRSHPPYNAEWEAIYKSHLERRDKNLFPDTIRAMVLDGVINPPSYTSAGHGDGDVAGPETTSFLRILSPQGSGTPSPMTCAGSRFAAATIRSPTTRTR